MTEKLVIADFDGTLACIRKKPEKVRLSKKMRIVLQRLLKKNVQILVLSARPNSFLRTVLPAGIRIMGSRGNRDLSRFQKKTKKIQKSFFGISREFPGVTLKKCPGGLDIHYRTAPRIREKKLEKAVFQRAKAIGVQVRKGRKMFEIVPRGLHDKKKMATAVAKNWKGRILFLGDDESDAEAASALSGKKNCQCFLRKTAERKKNPRNVRLFSSLSQARRILSRFADQ